MIVKYFNILFNIILITSVCYGVFQVIPTLISSNNTTEFLGGIGVILLVLTFVITRVVDMYETFKKGENNE